MKKLIILILCICVVISLPGCKGNNKDVLKKYSKLVLEIVCLSYDNYGDYSKIPLRYHKYISKDLFELLNYRDIDYNDENIYGKYGVDYYAVNSISYPVARFDGDNIVVSYEYTYETKAYDGGKNPGFYSSNIPVEVILNKIGNNYCVMSITESP